MEILPTIGNVLLATLPGLFWLWWFVRQDKREPEPRQYLWRIFLLGMLVTIPALFLEYAIALFLPYATGEFGMASIAGVLLVVGPLEELAKFLVVKTSVYHTKAFNERADGVIYMVVAALGFATVENILVALSDGASALPLRLITATLLHALASGIVGYYLGLAKFNKKKAVSLIWQGLVIGIVLHGLYDFIAISDSSVKLLLLLLFVLLMFLILQSSFAHLKADDSADAAKRRKVEP